MDYKDQIDPELRDTARQVPFNRRIIRVGNLYQSAVLKLMKIPGDVAAKTIEIEGYQDKKYKTEIFTPADAKGPMPALIYVHGGAFCYKAAAYHKNLACIYAAKAKCKVFFPDYHLAPEYPYPAGLEDVRSLYRYVSERAEELGIRKDMIGLAGDSAGATIAALICNEYELPADARLSPYGCGYGDTVHERVYGYTLLEFIKPAADVGVLLRGPV